MIKYVDILHSVCKTLKENYKQNDIIIDDTEESIKKPTFSVKIFPLKASEHFKMDFKKLNVYIEYIEKKKVSQEKILEISDNLRMLFRDYVVTGNRKIPILNKEFNDTTYKLTIAYYDDNNIVNANDDYDALMEIINTEFAIDD